MQRARRFPVYSCKLLRAYHYENGHVRRHGNESCRSGGESPGAARRKGCSAAPPCAPRRRLEAPRTQAAQTGHASSRRCVGPRLSRLRVGLLLSSSTARLRRCSRKRPQFHLELRLVGRCSAPPSEAPVPLLSSHRPFAAASLPLFRPWASSSVGLLPPRCLRSKQNKQTRPA